MSHPNYSFCKEYCSGRLPNCRHYEGRFGGLCETYKLLAKQPSMNKPERQEVSLEKLIILAGEIL